MSKIGLVTGGGDSPGINAAIRAVVREGRDNGYEIIGFKNGWAGVIDEDWEELNREDVSGILPLGGTILGSSRTNPFSQEEGGDRIKEIYEKNDLSSIIVIGGDDTLGVAHKLKDYGINIQGLS